MTHLKKNIPIIEDKRTLKTAKLINKLIGEKDPFTVFHMERVAKLAVEIAKKMNLSSKNLFEIGLGANLHDIGKISIPYEILYKYQRLTNKEFNLIKTHPLSGIEIIQLTDFPTPVFNIIKEHHERLNGSGYPLGLTKYQISIEAQIVAIADVFEASSSHRPYRPGVGTEGALDILTKGKGELFNSKIVDICKEIINKENFRFNIPRFFDISFREN